MKKNRIIAIPAFLGFFMFPMHLHSDFIYDALSETERSVLLKSFLEEDKLKARDKLIYESIDNKRGKDFFVELNGSGLIGPDYILTNGMSLLNYAVLLNDYDLVSYLISNHGNEISELSKLRSLKSACINGHSEVVDFFLEYDVVDLQEESIGMQCILYAVNYSNIRIFKLLLDKRSTMELLSSEKEVVADLLDKKLNDFLLMKGIIAE